MISNYVKKKFKKSKRLKIMILDTYMDHYHINVNYYDNIDTILISMVIIYFIVVNLTYKNISIYFVIINNFRIQCIVMHFSYTPCNIISNDYKFRIIVFIAILVHIIQLTRKYKNITPIGKYHPREYYKPILKNV